MKRVSITLLLFLALSVFSVPSAAPAFEERLLGRKIEDPIDSMDREEKRKTREEIRRWSESVQKENDPMKKDESAQAEKNLPSQPKDQ